MPNTLPRLSSITALLAAIAVAAPPAGAAHITPPLYTRAVTRICAHAMLFENSHAIGTRAGALELADDIRASTRHRLARVADLPTPPSERPTVARWLALEAHLADTYALDYVRIYDLIAAPRTKPDESARAARRLASLVHAPDRLRGVTERLEQRLRVPDCTGGSVDGGATPGGVLVAS